MSRKTRTTLTVVEKLIEQRRLFQDWLTKLKGEVDGMPGHVVERVRNDYRARFDAVMRELGDHRDALREALAEAQERHDGLDSQHRAKKDELAELKLRKQVGEIDENRFREQSGAMKAMLDSLQKEMAAAERDLQRYEEILDVISEDEKKPAAAAPQADLDDDEEYEDEEDEEEEEEEEARPVATRSAAPPPAPKPAPAPAPRPSPAPDQKKSVDDMAFLRSITPPTGIAPVSAAPAPAPQRAPTPAPAPQPAPQVENFDAAPGLVHLSSAFEPAAPAPAAATPGKKEEGLVCGECGALNRPTEWYCEKCGAELAAL